jgi:hypothetical protein
MKVFASIPTILIATANILAAQSALPELEK